jgi:5'-methylthioadenosine phosphorylase
MDGPAFSTRAESETNRRLGFHVIGMTNLPEAKLAREAEIAMATLAMVTDYDCWKEDEGPVDGQAVMGHVAANAELAKKILAGAVPRVPREADWPEHSALATGLITPRERWPEGTARELAPLLAGY